MKDLSNKKFGKLTVLKFLKTDSHYNSFWLCKCDCGNEIAARADHLQRGGTKSCGCLRNKNMPRAMYENGGKRLQRILMSCIKRCENPSEPYYNRYGGRGIKVCDEWKNDFQKFYDWSMANGYRDNLTIDRIDNDKGYSPVNCRWVDMKIQSNNRCNNRRVCYQGQEYTLSELADKLGIEYKHFWYLIKKGKLKELVGEDNASKN